MDKKSYFDPNKGRIVHVGEEEPEAPAPAPAPVPEAEATGERARTAKGHFVKDDESTPEVNEAYKDGKTPKKKATTKKNPKN
jgi:hypothetical protein